MQTNPDGRRRLFMEFMVTFQVIAAQMELFDKMDLKDSRKKIRITKGRLPLTSPFCVSIKKDSGRNVGEFPVRWSHRTDSDTVIISDCECYAVK